MKPLILFITNNTDMETLITPEILSHFQIELINFNETIIQKKLSSTEPFFILIDLINLTPRRLSVLDVLNNELMKNTPIVLIGTKQECSFFQHEIDSDIRLELYPPVTSSILLFACIKIWNPLSLADMDGLKINI